MITTPRKPFYTGEKSTYDLLIDMDTWGTLGWAKAQELDAKLEVYGAEHNAIRAKWGWKRDGRELPELVDEVFAKLESAETEIRELHMDMAELHPMGDCAQELHDLRKKLEAAEITNDRLRQERLDYSMVIQAVTPDGLNASEWIWRTGKAERERDHYKALAGELAEALRGAIDYIVCALPTKCDEAFAEELRSALAKFEEGIRRGTNWWSRDRRKVLPEHWLLAQRERPRW